MARFERVPCHDVLCNGLTSEYPDMRRMTADGLIRRGRNNKFAVA